jgi:hypothetical protein
MQMHISRRVTFGTALGLVVATAGLATASILPYQAVCEQRSCHWIGVPRADALQVCLDARDHWTRTGHPVSFKGLPRSVPRNAGEVGEADPVPEGGPLFLAAIGEFPGHFRFRFEAYLKGQLVGTYDYETDAQNPAQLQALMANAQAGFGQRLRDHGKDWDAIYPIRKW